MPFFVILTGTAIVLLGMIRLKLHPALSLLFAALVTALLTTPEMILAFAQQKGMSKAQALSLTNISVGKRLSAAFGNTCAKIGIIVALASVIGTALMRSGGAERIIRGILKLFGVKNTGIALLFSSFTLAIPVFLDTVFYLMIPLVKSLTIRTPQKFSLYLMAIIAGGVMAHSLIPPPPGPLFVAEELGIDLGAMILGGLVIGIITVLAGYGYAVWANKKWTLPMRDTPDISVSELTSDAQRSTKDLPGLGFSLFPILLPILLITGNTFSTLLLAKGTLPYQLLTTLGDANMALFISAIMAM